MIIGMSACPQTWLELCSSMDLLIVTNAKYTKAYNIEPVYNRMGKWGGFFTGIFVQIGTEPRRPHDKKRVKCKKHYNKNAKR